MWGSGDNHYWRKKGRIREGVVVVFACMFNVDSNLKSCIDFYSSLNWNCLICHSGLLNLFLPEKAEKFAFEILKELVEELQLNPCPVVLASFSGGSKACMYKIFQIIEGKCELKVNQDCCRLVRSCIAGNIYDSSPVDFVSDLTKKLLVHPSVIKMSHPPKLLSWIANGMSSGVDALFSERFESQRVDYWQTLYSSVTLAAPYLIIGSENDDLAPFQIVCDFAQKLQELGGDVKFVSMNSLHADDYKAAVKELLVRAAELYCKRTRRHGGEVMILDGEQDERDDISYAMTDLGNLSEENHSFRGFAIPPIDHFVEALSSDYYGAIAHDEEAGGLLPLGGVPSGSTHGVLGQMLYDVCVPKSVDEWDLKSPPSVSRWPYANPMRCIWRSRL